MFDQKRILSLAGAFMILGPNLKFLNAYLNSKIALYLYNMICTSSGMSTNLWHKFSVEKLLVPKDIDTKEIKKIETLVDEIYKTKNEIEVKKLIRKIDNFFYDYYQLNENEITLIEN